MKKIVSLKRDVGRMLNDDSGQGMVEYILIIGLIVLFIVVALIAFRKQIEGFIKKIGDWIDKQDAPG